MKDEEEDVGKLKVSAVEDSLLLIIHQFVEEREYLVPIYI